MKKITLSIVMASEKDLYLASMFQGLEGVEFDILLLGEYGNIPKINLDYSLKVFKSLDNMPEYFRGLSLQLKHCDIVVVVDSHYRSSFQSLSAACKLGKPLVVLQTLDHCPFLNEDMEQYRMMMQVMRGADHIFALNSQCLDFLVAENISCKKITIARMNIDKRATFNVEAREKFRSYIQQDRHSIIISVSSNNAEDSENLLRSIKRVIQRKPILASRLKFLLITSAATHQLKYLASDLGIGRYIFFISQNIENFKGDLFSACDLFLDLTGYASRCINPMMLDAIGYGVLPIARIIDSCDPLKKTCVPLEGNDFESLSDAIIEGVSQYKSEGRVPQKKIAILRGELLKMRDEISFQEKFNNLLEGYEMEGKNSNIVFEETMTIIESEMDNKNFVSAISYFNLLIESAGQDLTKKSEALRFNGDCYLKLGDLESAMSAYDESIQLNDKNWKAFLGLGKLSLRTYSEEDALSFFKKVLAIMPNQVEALSGIGSVHRMIGMADDSIYWFQRALSLDMTNKTLLFELTQACLECLETQAPINVLESLRASLGEEPSLVMALGQLYLESGNIEEGQRMVARALESNKVGANRLYLRTKSV